MGHFRTEDDYTPVGGDSYTTDNGYGYGDSDNPEVGNPGGYGTVQKPGIIERILSALGNAGSGLGTNIQNGITLEKVLFVLYIIAMVFVVLNFTTVIDFLFYATMSVLQYIIILLVVFLLGFIFCRFILHIR